MKQPGRNNKLIYKDYAVIGNWLVVIIRKVYNTEGSLL